MNLGFWQQRAEGRRKPAIRVAHARVMAVTGSIRNIDREIGQVPALRVVWNVSLPTMCAVQRAASCWTFRKLMKRIVSADVFPE